MSLSLLKSADQIPLEPVITLVGPEDFVRRKLKDRLIERALAGAVKDLNFSTFQAGDDELAKALEACRDFPCLAAKRVVRIAGAGKIRKKESEAFLAYLEKPQDTTVLIVDDEKLDGRLDWVKALKKRSHWIDIPAAKPEEARDWARILLKREGKKAGEDIVGRLVDWMGNSHGALQLAVAQLALFTGDRDELALQDLEALFVKLSEENVFEVIRAIFSRDSAELHAGLKRLLAMGEPPLMILALLYRHLSILLALKAGKDREVASIFRVNPYFLREYQVQMRSFGKRLDVGLLAPLAQADFQLKSSSLPDELILEKTVEDIQRLLA
jgi:DNA polymerase-3 subunit delta